MAYHVGRILKLDFGYNPISVLIGSETWDHTKHLYDPEFPTLSVKELVKNIACDDIVVINPSYSNLMLGLQSTCTKICYVQGFNTYALLDAFDHYVAVSGIVKRFLQAVYEIDAPVIPPFFERDSMPRLEEWNERPQGSVFVYVKGPYQSAAIVLDELKKRVTPNVRFVDVVQSMSLPRRDLLFRMAACRYMLTLSPAEGFGLVPLEAMAVGTAVVGFDAFGGRDYFRNMENCAVVPWPKVDLLSQYLIAVVENESLGARLARAGTRTPELYTYELFRSAWKHYLTTVVGLTPVA